MVLEFDRHGSAGDDVLGEYSFNNRSKEFCAYILLTMSAVVSIFLFFSLQRPRREILYIRTDASDEQNNLSQASFCLEKGIPNVSDDDSACSARSGSTRTAASGRRSRLSDYISSNLILTADEALQSVAEILDLVDVPATGIYCIKSTHIAIKCMYVGFRDKGDGAEDKFIEGEILDVAAAVNISNPLQQSNQNFGDHKCDDLEHELEGHTGFDFPSKVVPGKQVVISLYNIGLVLPSTEPRVTNKTLLYNVNGCIMPKQLCAVMGPSGSGNHEYHKTYYSYQPNITCCYYVVEGKTALLDIIFGNHMGKAAEQGKVLFNNTSRTPQTQRRLAYVPASDIHIPVLTVRETLWYAAALRMQFGVDMEKKKAVTEEVLRMLGLAKVF